MPIFVMLSEVATGRTIDPKGLEQLEKQVVARIEKECPDVDWIGNYALLGPYDYLDIFYAPDTDSAFKVATIIRTFGHARTEIWPATDWSHFKHIARELPRGEL